MPARTRHKLVICKKRAQKQVFFMKHFSSGLPARISAIVQRIKTDIIQYKALIAALLICMTVLFLLFHKICVFSIVIGYPCPGCGITRALMLFLTFQWREAFAMNPMIFIWIPFIVYAAVCRYVLNRRMKHFTVICTAVCVLSLAVYGIRMYFLYPGTVPMTYYEQNVLHTVKTFFSRLF